MVGNCRHRKSNKTTHLTISKLDRTFCSYTYILYNPQTMEDLLLDYIFRVVQCYHPGCRENIPDTVSILTPTIWTSNWTVPLATHPIHFFNFVCLCHWRHTWRPHSQAERKETSQDDSPQFCIRWVSFAVFTSINRILLFQQYIDTLKAWRISRML